MFICKKGEKSVPGTEAHVGDKATQGNEEQGPSFLLLVDFLDRLQLQEGLLHNWSVSN